MCYLHRNGRGNIVSFQKDFQSASSVELMQARFESGCSSTRGASVSYSPLHSRILSVAVCSCLSVLPQHRSGDPPSPGCSLRGGRECGGRAGHSAGEVFGFQRDQNFMQSLEMNCPENLSCSLIGVECWRGILWAGL